MNTIRYLVSGKGIFNSICDLIIRPQRAVYDPRTDLGPTIFRLDADDPQRYKRTDLTIENMRGLTLQCSWFRTLSNEKQPCIVYIHGNCGSRYDALEALFLLKEGYSLFCFDAAGSGLSDGEYISLGFYERQDLAAVVDYLEDQEEVDGIGLWGRSMGAVTSIMYASKDNSIKCIVCDSPFSTLRSLVNDLVKQHGSKRFPNSLINKIVNRMRKRIAARAAFNIDDLDTLKYASECTVPAFIFHGREDDFVFPRNSIDVSNYFMGPCLHHLVDGGHNDERGEDVRNTIKGFFSLYLVLKRENGRPVAHLMQDATNRVPREYIPRVDSGDVSSSPERDGDDNDNNSGVGGSGDVSVDDGGNSSNSDEVHGLEGSGDEEEPIDEAPSRPLSASLAPVRVTKPWFYDPNDLLLDRKD